MLLAVEKRPGGYVLPAPGVDSTFSQSRPAGATHFGRLLFAVCVAQGTAIVGFDFALPFMPLYLQKDLGVHGLGQIAIWAGIVGFGPAIPATIFGPLWGRVADRYGYRVMLLRAMASAAILLAIMGTVQSVWVLVALRMIQGSLTGTIYSAQALIATAAPEDETGHAMGLLQMSIYAGATLGPIGGGFVAGIAGYRASFIVAGILVAIATAVVFAFVFEPDRAKRHTHELSNESPKPSFIAILAWPPFASAVVFTIISQFAANAPFPILPLFVQELLHGHGSISEDTGWVLALSGLAAAGGSYAAGRIQRRLGIARPLIVASFGCAGLLVLQSLSSSYIMFLLARGFAAIALGALFALVGAWTANASPRDARGAAFGLVGAASSLGFGAGPLLGGVIVSFAGLRSVFLTGAVMLLVGGVAALAGGRVFFGKQQPNSPVRHVPPNEIGPENLAAKSSVLETN